MSKTDRNYSAYWQSSRKIIDLDPVMIAIWKYLQCASQKEKPRTEVN